MRTAAAALVLLALAGCPNRGQVGGNEPPGDPYPGREQSLRGLLLRELEIEMIEGYDLPTFETAVPPTAVSSKVGAVHLGVGPDDITAGKLLSIDRWPLLPLDDSGFRLDDARSKHLEMKLSSDLTAAWVADEVSYRVPGCRAGEDDYKSAVLPLRLTAVFVRDGERWVEVLEHISYPQPVAELVDRATGRATGKKMRNGRDPRPAVQEPIGVLQRALAVDLPDDERALLFASDHDALAMWPDPAHELRGSAVLSAASLTRSFDARTIKLETWRIGMSPDPTGGVGGGSLAWVAATLLLEIDRPHGDEVEKVKLRLRGTFVLERRSLEGGPRWQIVQSHVSAPVDDPVLISAISGSGSQLPDDEDADEEAVVPPWEQDCGGPLPSAPPSISHQ